MSEKKLTLADELLLSEKRQRLERERDELRAKLTQVEDKIRAFDLLMHDKQFLDYVVSQSAYGKPKATNGGAIPSGTAVPSVGVRSAIRAVLGRTPDQPMKPIQVSGLLHQDGYDSAAGHDFDWLKLRVSQEMHRMMKAGTLKRSSNGRYRIAEGLLGTIE